MVTDGCLDGLHARCDGKVSAGFVCDCSCHFGAAPEPIAEAPELPDLPPPPPLPSWHEIWERRQRSNVTK
jgi:hypothetical protein